MTNVAWFAFLVAAAIGAPARYVIDELVKDHTEGAFPWGTFVVNVTGCFALGAITGLGMYHGLGSTTGTVLGSGGMGAYTTFSTFTFETVRLAEGGAINEACRNAVGSFAFGLAAAGAGIALAALL